jgi:hypothetical protein
MYQADRGDYRTKESIFSLFFHSCMGRILIVGIIIGILSGIACLTRPSEEVMTAEMVDDIRQCINRSDSVNSDKLDNMVANFGYIFSSADTVVDVESWKNFKRYNRLQYFDHGTYATMLVFNNYNVEGTRCGIGIFGIVIPTVNFIDLLLRDGPIQTDESNFRPVEIIGDDEYFGETPDLIFREENYDQ